MWYTFGIGDVFLAESKLREGGLQQIGEWWWCQNIQENVQRAFRLLVGGDEGAGYKHWNWNAYTVAVSQYIESLKLLGSATH